MEQSSKDFAAEYVTRFAKIRRETQQLRNELDEIIGINDSLISDDDIPIEKQEKLFIATSIMIVLLDSNNIRKIKHNLCIMLFKYIGARFGREKSTEIIRAMEAIDKLEVSKN